VVHTLEEEAETQVAMARAAVREALDLDPGRPPARTLKLNLGIADDESRTDMADIEEQ
jgi:hypothetical protein